MTDEDRLLLEEMLENAFQAQNFFAGLGSRHLTETPVVRYSVLHAVQLIGQAAAKVSPEVKSRLPEIPWRDIVSTRNIIVHGYRSIDPEIIGRIVDLHLPPMEAAIKRLLAEEP